ncbi:aminoglycoside phosphotransferase family protein, partial [Bacillus sp. HC-Mk]
MEEMLREIERILEWPRMLKATVISKGFSFDEKYKIELESGASYFIKVCDSSYSSCFRSKYDESHTLIKYEAPLSNSILYFSSYVKSDCYFKRLFIR